MTNVTISLPKEKPAKIRKKAALYGISAEALLPASIDPLLQSPDEEFDRRQATYLNRTKSFTKGLPNAFPDS